MLLFYIRHGEPIYDPDSLTPLGKIQAEAVSKRLSAFGIDEIYASTSNRAIETATPTSIALNKDIKLLDFCNEGHVWNDFTVLSKDGTRTWAFFDENIKKIFAERAFSQDPNCYDDPRLPKNKFKQGIDRVNKATDDWLLSLGYEHDREKCLFKAIKPSEKRIALFAHQGFGMTFLSSILDIPFPMFSVHFDIGHSDITVIEFDDKNGVVIPKILTHSNDSHLYSEGLSTQYNYKWTF